MAACILLGGDTHADVSAHITFLKEQPPKEPIYIINPQGAFRIAIVADDIQQACTNLDEQNILHTKPSTVAFLFTGQGAQYPLMGHMLFEEDPIFKKHLTACAQAITHMDLIQLLFTPHDDPHPIHQTIYTQPALMAFEYALAKTYAHYGLCPNHVMGHSVGEIAAATYAQALNYQEGMYLISERAQRMQALPQGGGMLAVMADLKTITDTTTLKDIDVAAENTPKQTVLSGPIPALEALASTLKEKRIRTRMLQVSHAFHSHLMAPMLKGFEDSISHLKYMPPHINIISNVTAKPIENYSNHYWLEHIRQPVDFMHSIQTIKNCNIFVEIGPAPILTNMAQKCLTECEGKSWISGFDAKGKGSYLDFQQTLCDAFLSGAPWQPVNLTAQASTVSS